jgi:hypothetical protein
VVGQIPEEDRVGEAESHPGDAENGERDRDGDRPCDWRAAANAKAAGKIAAKTSRIWKASP